MSQRLDGILLYQKRSTFVSQNPRAWMSRRASQATFTPLFKVSPVISCRTGSVSTSFQTRSSRSASRSRNSLCMTLNNKATMFIKHGAIHTKAISILTNGECAHYFPIIPKMDSIFQFSLVQVTVRVLIGNYC